MNRFSDLERQYILDVITNEFSASKNSIYNDHMEKKFSELMDVKFSIGHINGTATMHTALAALGIGAEDEVIVPPLTMSSPSLAVLQNGSVPVFADVDLKTFNISAESIKKVITPKTKAILTVALYGLSPEYDDIIEICKQNNLYLIEDNAECFLGKYKNKYVGQFGDFASFSFQASKHLTCGDGGMLVTNNEELADKARRFSSLGFAGVSARQSKITRLEKQDPNYNRHVSLGFNYRMSEGNAAIVLAQLERANELVNQRMKVAEIFDHALQNQDLLTRQFTPDYSVNSYWCYSMVLNTNKPETDWYTFRDLFLKKGGDSFYAAWKLSYFEPLFLNETQNDKRVWQKYKTGLCPNAEFLQPRMIQLKTNYWNLDEAKKQAAILKKTIQDYSSSGK